MSPPKSATHRLAVVAAKVRLYVRSEVYAKAEPGQMPPVGAFASRSLERALRSDTCRPTYADISRTSPFFSLYVIIIGLERELPIT